MQSNRIPWLSRAVLVERHELPALLGGFLYFFCLLCSYYILRPVRDEMGVRGGVENLHWLFTATFFAMLVAVPIFAALAGRLTRARLIPASYGFFITCLVAFWLWLRTGVALDWGARTFFVWLSVFNLFVVSVFWSFMADLFEARQGGPPVRRDCRRRQYRRHPRARRHGPAGPAHRAGGSAADRGRCSGTDPALHPWAQSLVAALLQCGRRIARSRMADGRDSF